MRSRCPDVQQIKPFADLDLPGIKVQPEQLPLIDYFVGDLQLRYSFDDPKYISSVSAADLKRLKLKREELLPLAIANFRRRYPKFKVERMQARLALGHERRRARAFAHAGRGLLGPGAAARGQRHRRGGPGARQPGLHRRARSPGTSTCCGASSRTSTARPAPTLCRASSFCGTRDGGRCLPEG